MRDRYWNMYTEKKHMEQYALQYQIKAYRVNAAINAFSLLAAASTIAGWQVWKNFPLVWSVIVCVSQIIQVLKPLFPFSKQLTGLRFFLPALESLLLEIEHEWDTEISAEDEDSDKISDLILSRRKDYNAIEEQFLGDVYMPYSSRCDKKARSDCNKFFEHTYQVHEEE